MSKSRLVVQIARHSIQCLPVLLFICEHRKQCNDIVLQEVCMLSGKQRNVPAIVDPQSRLLISGTGTVLKYLCRLTESSWYPQELTQQAIVDQHLETFAQLFKDLRTVVSRFVIDPTPGHYELVRPTLIRVVDGLTRLDAECRKILIRRRQRKARPSSSAASPSVGGVSSRMAECYFLPGTQSPSLADIVALCGLLQLNLLKFWDVRTHWPSLCRWMDVVARRLGSEFYSLAGPEWGVERGVSVLQGRHQTLQLRRRLQLFPNGIPSSTLPSSASSPSVAGDNAASEDSHQEDGAEELTGGTDDHESVDEEEEDEARSSAEAAQLGLSPSLSGLISSNLRLHKLAAATYLTGAEEDIDRQGELPDVIGASPPQQDDHSLDGSMEGEEEDQLLLDGSTQQNGDGWELVSPNPSPNNRRSRTFTPGSLSSTRAQAHFLLQQQQNSISAANIALHDSLLCCEHLLQTVDHEFRKLERLETFGNTVSSAGLSSGAGQGKLTPQQWETELLRIHTFVPRPLGPKAKHLFAWPPELPNTESIAQSSQYVLAQGRVPASVERVAKFLRQPEALQLLSQNSRNSTFGISVVATCDSQTRLAGGRLQLHHRTDIGTKTARFDFNLALHHLSLRDRTHIASYVSCPDAGIHIKRPPGYVRARVLQAGWVVRPVDPVVSYPNPAAEAEESSRAGAEEEAEQGVGAAADSGDEHLELLLAERRLEKAKEMVAVAESSSSSSSGTSNSIEEPSSDPSASAAGVSPLASGSPVFVSLMEHTGGPTGMAGNLESFMFRTELLGGRLEAQPTLQPTRLTGLARPVRNRNPLEELMHPHSGSHPNSPTSSSPSGGGGRAEASSSSSSSPSASSSSGETRKSGKRLRKKSQKSSGHPQTAAGIIPSSDGPQQNTTAIRQLSVNQKQQGNLEEECHVSFVLHIAFPARVSTWIPEKLRQLPPEYIKQLQAIVKFGKLDHL